MAHSCSSAFRCSLLDASGMERPVPNRLLRLLHTAFAAHPYKGSLRSAATASSSSSPSPKELLVNWQKASDLEGRDHASTLYHVGRLVRGKGAGQDKAHWHHHESMQKALQQEPAFQELLKTVLQSMSELSSKDLSRMLMGLSDTHEDLPFEHAEMAPDQLRLILALADAASAKLVDAWQKTDEHDNRDLAFPMFALSQLAFYNEALFTKGSELLAKKLSGSGCSWTFRECGESGESCSLPVEGLRQWLLACNSVGHSLSHFQEEIRRYPRSSWQSDSEPTSRLHQLAGSLAHLNRPDPLLSEVLREINKRPLSQIKAGNTTALYGLQAVRILVEKGFLEIEERLSPSLADSLDFWMQAKAQRVLRRSALEAAVASALSRCGFEPQREVSLGYGLTADFQCCYRGRIFFLEVDGPSHFCVRPIGRLRGRTIMKRRLFAACGHTLVALPYWLASDVILANKEEFHEMVVAQLARQPG